MKFPSEIYKFSLLLILTLILVFVSIGLGSFSHLLHFNLSEWEIISIREIRLPRTIAAVLSGIALAVSGMQMQSVFRNPLAGPYVLGISSGGALGVAIITMGFSAFGLHLSGYAAFSSVVIASALGSLLFLLVIFAVYLRLKNPVSVLVAGVLLGSSASALVSILQYFASERDIKSFVVWTMGSLGSIDQKQLSIFIPVVIAGIILSFFLNNALNLLRAGDEYASVLGVKVKLTRILIFITTGLLTGSVMAFCGPLAFIGVAVPHITRMIFNSSDHRVIFPGVILTGAFVMLGADILSRSLIQDIQIPVNSVTSLVGIPVVFWVLFKGRKLFV
ncbi:MAG: iron ABC transporter [Bacteroidetes bacterium HGW-Bacteroidetes-21]|nr:MAG: iron ABC transporter [Bacteroidetes bacterium HGW-Bacteroidetes-21]